MGNGFWDQPSVLGAPTPDTYKQMARDQHVPRGSTRAIALPQSLPGFMVGRSTLEGAPVGWDQNGLASRINVDPDIAGEGFTVDMSKVATDAFQQATAGAQLRQSVSIDDLRNRASSVYRQFASGAEPVPNQGEASMPTQPQPMWQTPPQPQQPPQPPHQQPQPSAQGPAPTMPNPDTAPYRAAEFTANVPQAPPAAPPAAPAACPAPVSLFERLDPPRVAPGPTKAARVAGGAPTYRVTFEVKGSPMSIETWYHDIIRDEHVLVLVYDTSCVGYPRSRLQPTDSDIAVHVEGSDALYLVQDPSITFEFGTQEFQVLLIKSEHPFGGTAAIE